MSVRAYEVKKIVRGDIVFNLWHDDMVMELIGNDIYNSLNQDGCGMTEVSQERIENALQELKKKRQSKEKKYTKEVLENMLKLAIKYNGYLMLECF